MCPQWVIGARSNIFRPFRIALAHGWRRTPAWAFDLAHHFGAATAGQIFGQRHGAWVELIGAVFPPIMQGAAGDIDKDGAVLQIVKIGLPPHGTKAGGIATHRFGEIALYFGGGRPIDVLRQRRCANKGGPGRQEGPAAHCEFAVCTHVTSPQMGTHFGAIYDRNASVANQTSVIWPISRECGLSTPRPKRYTLSK